MHSCEMHKAKFLEIQRTLEKARLIVRAINIPLWNLKENNRI
jgi:hypothetical protein